jgi:tetratricopeptide (TPR) repeat protein
MTTRLTALLFSFVLTVAAQDAETLIARGDAHDAAFRTQEALACYLPALEQRPNDAGLLVKIARQHAHRMNDLSDPAAKLAEGRKALDCAERAVRAEPGRGEAHLAVAICLGKLTPLLGTREKIEASRRLGEAAETAVRLDPRSDYAWHLLGRWHQALAGMSGLVRGVAQIVYGGLPPASNEEAVRCFQKAIALRPDRLIHPVELGRTYAQMGRRDEARAFLQKGLSLPPREKDDPETQARGRAALATLE